MSIEAMAKRYRLRLGEMSSHGAAAVEEASCRMLQFNAFQICAEDTEYRRICFAEEHEMKTGIMHAVELLRAELGFLFRPCVAPLWRCSPRLLASAH